MKKAAEWYIPLSGFLHFNEQPQVVELCTQPHSAYRQQGEKIRPHWSATRKTREIAPIYGILCINLGTALSRNVRVASFLVLFQYRIIQLADKFSCL